MKMLFTAAVLCLFVLPVGAYKLVPLEQARNVTKPKFSGTFGVDVSQPVSVGSFQCMKGAGIQFVIVRAYLSIGQPDPNAPQTIANARAAGIPYVDVYMFPCPTCSTSPADQVKEMLDKLSGSNYGQIWLDIEGPQYWKSSVSDNQYFFKNLLFEAELHKKTGVYTSASQWDPIMGSDYTGGSAHQLWYAHYDGNPSFSDFYPFGGWSNPAIKQYEGNVYLCSTGVDKNWY